MSEAPTFRRPMSHATKNERSTRPGRRKTDSSGLDETYCGDCGERVAVTLMSEHKLVWCKPTEPQKSEAHEYFETMRAYRPECACGSLLLTFTVTYMEDDRFPWIVETCHACGNIEKTGGDYRDHTRGANRHA